MFKNTVADEAFTRLDLHGGRCKHGISIGLSCKISYCHDLRQCDYHREDFSGSLCTDPPVL